MAIPGSPLIDALALAARWQAASRRRGIHTAWPTGLQLAVGLPIATSVLAVLSTPLRERVATLLGILGAHALPFAIFAAAFAWTWARERRRSGEREHARSWLAAAPISARDVTTHLRRRAIVDFGAPCVAIGAALALIAMAGDCEVHALLASSAMAVVVGFATGWRSGRHTLADVPPAPPRIRHRRAAATANAHFDALRRWPFAHWLAAAQPRQHARVIAALLLSMPMGLGFGAALGIVLLAALALAAIGLLRAWLASIEHAGDFLRGTPLSVRTFASNIATRALVAESLIATCAATLAIVGGAGIAVSCVGAVAWILLCAAAGAHALHRELKRGTNA